MTDMTLVHPGPYFKEEDLAPFLNNKKSPLAVRLPGVRGTISRRYQARNTRYLAVTTPNDRLIQFDFSRGEPLVIVCEESKYVVIARKEYDAQLTEKANAEN